jgi:hypothetical protein
LRDISHDVFSWEFRSAASDEIDQFEFVSLVQRDARIFRLRNYRAIELDRDARRLHLENLDERGQTRVALDDLSFAIELQRDLFIVL